MKHELPQLTDRDGIAGRTFLVRGALNVPIEDGAVANDFRLKSLLPTVSWLRSRGGRVILIGHISGTETKSLRPVADYFAEQTELDFIADYAGGQAQDAVDDMKNGDLLLFENLRQYAEEKANDDDFAQNLAAYADAYVNEAFPAAHREHASIVGVPKHLPCFAGKQFISEVDNISRALDPARPFTFILGGAKFSTKLPVAEKFTSIADDVFVAGAIANAYLQADDQPVGRSTLPETAPALEKGLQSTSLHLPVDVMVEPAEGEATTKPTAEVTDADTIVDIGPRTLEQITDSTDEADLAVWNGPTGWYEKGYTEHTNQLAQALAETDAETIIGGGDTTAVILDEFSADAFSFVSTAGGAMIQFLANETLPGIEALKS